MARGSPSALAQRDSPLISSAPSTHRIEVDLPIPTRYAGEVSHLRPIPYGIAVLKLMGRYLRGDYHRLVGGHPAARP